MAKALSGDPWHLIRSAARRLKDVSDSSLLDAELLLGHVLNVDRTGLRMINDPLTSAQIETFNDLVNRRLKSEPIQYIIGSAWFYGLEFMVSNKVLIPRPETELLVDCALHEMRKRAVPNEEKDEVTTIVDCCTGSGAIAISVAANCNGRANVYGTDISAEALEVARENSKAHGTKVQFRLCDLLEDLASEKISIDILLANPPYIPIDDKQSLPQSVVAHEPHIALFLPVSDGSSSAVIERIVDQAKPLLSPGSLVAFEVGQGQHVEVEDLLKDQGFNRVRSIRDLAGIERVVEARWS